MALRSFPDFDGAPRLHSRLRHGLPRSSRQHTLGEPVASTDHHGHGKGQGQQPADIVRTIEQQDIGHRVTMPPMAFQTRRETKTNLDRKVPHRHHQHQARKNLLVPPPRSQTTPLPPVHGRTSTRGLVPIKRPRHIFHGAEPTALMRVLDPPDRVPIKGSPETQPAFGKLACQDVGGEEVRDREGGEDGFVDG
ncbi:MAG: hypothetical protein LQ346_009106 [Caloplaca aetnensis]|nr:MAG: hypothetical protein LQ346_009106 [Caloplaca aetnensis]